MSAKKPAKKAADPAANESEVVQPEIAETAAKEEKKAADPVIGPEITEEEPEETLYTNVSKGLVELEGVYFSSGEQVVLSEADRKNELLMKRLARAIELKMIAES